MTKKSGGGDNSGRDWPHSAPRAERAYELRVLRHLRRNFLAHLGHGMLGQTGFRLLNAPTFLPAYLLLLSGGSDLVVGAALALQSLGMTLTPFAGASLVQHRLRVLPVGFVIGAAVRLAVLVIAIAGLLLAPPTALATILVAMLALGALQGMQGVVFNTLLAKVIPVSHRGRLTGLRNFTAGLTAAAVAFVAGTTLLGDTPTVAGYSYTFLLAFALAALGLMVLTLMKEPGPPSLPKAATTFETARRALPLLRKDQGFSYFVTARVLATLGRMAMPFYILHAGTTMALSGDNLAAVTIAFTLAGNFSNLLWGSLADRHGFRLVFQAAIYLWVLSTLMLFFETGVLALSFVFVGIGAAAQGFQQAAVNLTLEFGSRSDLPTRIAIANSTSELGATIATFAAGVIATLLGYGAVFAISCAFLVGGALLVTFRVPEPRRG